MTDSFEYSIATIPPTSRQQRLAAALVLLLIVGFFSVAPFAANRSVRLDSFVPSVQAMIFVADLATSVLLFSQYSNVGLRELVVLADGYLFSALIVIPHALSYPGAFTAEGLFGSGLQTSPWLYTFWHFGFSASVLVYACLKQKTSSEFAAPSVTRPMVYWNVIATTLVVCALTALVVAGGSNLPRLVINQVNFAPLTNYVGSVLVVTSVSALVVLWIRRSSLLDLWVLVAIVATIVEQGTVSLLTAGRFSVGFYASRTFSVAVSMIVLSALLSETVTLYARLARANRVLQRERDSKLMNLEVAVAALAHEIRQPLTAVATKSAAARRFLSRETPDIPRVQSILDEVSDAGFRTNEVIESVRALFRNTEQDQRPVDLNEVTLEALQMLRTEFDDYDITLTTQLAAELPLVMGHKGQLCEVVLNLAQNAVEAMAEVVDRKRRLRIETENVGGEGVAISVEDSGPGIGAQSTANIFDAFVTTKAKGRGLGLAISQMIVERHSGRIAVTPGAIRGARFRITLPTKPIGVADAVATQ